MSSAGLKDFLISLASGVPRHRKKFILTLVGALVAAYYYNRKNQRLQLDCPTTSKEKKKLSSNSTQFKVGVNLTFVDQLKKLIPICIPGVNSKEFALLIGLAAILILRTALDIWFAAFNGRVVRSIVTRDWKLFIKNAVYIFAIMMWPMSIVNNSIKYLINMLSLSFRERLTTFAHGEYLKGMTFYKVTNLDNRIKNVDQLITQDITKFSESLAHLYSDITKPIVDIGLFALKLGQSIGPNAPLLMLSYFFTSGYILKTISPPFGRFIAKEQSLEGEFRHAHSRIIAHSEEIAFYHGNLKEEKIINSAFGKIVQHCSMVHFLKFGNGIIDSVLVKYLATQLAYFILSRPVFSNSESTRLSVQDLQEDPTKIMEDYSRNSGYLINLSQAVGRLVLAGRDLTKFAGYTWRVSELFKVLDDLSESGRYERSMRNKMGIDEHRIITEGELEGNVVTELDKDTTTGSTSTSATTSLSPFIEFKNVPITTPNGDILVDNMNFRVEKGMNCMISGPNGCGKSSLFRILGQLWPIFSGTLTKPKEDEIFYVPQRPYLPIGSLRDQIIYPGLESKISDGELKELLKVVQLDYLVDREEGGLDAIRDWQDVLSGGEKQRLALTRLFYHRPAFAILDESTSAVSLDVEAIIYKYAQEVLEITLFTVSHRQSLIPFHEYLLKFDGEGGYEFKRMSTPMSIDFNSNEKETEKEKSSENMNIWMKNASIETSNSNMMNTQNNIANTDTNILNNTTASTSLPLSDYLMSTPQLLYSYPKQQHQPDHESDSSKKNSIKK